MLVTVHKSSDANEANTQGQYSNLAETRVSRQFPHSWVSLRLFPSGSELRNEQVSRLLPNHQRRVIRVGRDVTGDDAQIGSLEALGANDQQRLVHDTQLRVGTVVPHRHHLTGAREIPCRADTGAGRCLQRRLVLVA